MTLPARRVLGTNVQLSQASKLDAAGKHSRQARTVSKSWKKKYQELLKFKTGKMTPGEYDSLNEVGFAFDGHRARSDIFVRMMLCFHAEYGHCRVSGYDFDVDVKYPGLYGWVRRIRRKRRLGSIPRETIDALDRIGFDWDPRTSKFEKHFADLKAFKAQYGHCNVPLTHRKHPKLGLWLWNLRRYKRVDNFKRDYELEITAAQQRRLREIGFSLGTGEDTWELYYELLVEVYKERGTSNGPYPYGPKYRGLEEWVHHQRDLAQAGKLAEHQLELLNNLGLVWDTKRAECDVRISELSAMCDEFGFQTAFLELDLLQGQLESSESQRLVQVRSKKVQTQAERRANKVRNDLGRLREWYSYAKNAAGQGDLEAECITAIHKLGFLHYIEKDS